MVSARSIKAGAAYVELTIKDGQLVRGLERAKARLKAFSAGVMNLGKKLLAVSAAATVPLALSARTFSGFSDQMAEVQAVTGATAEEFEKLTEEAKRLGRTTSFTARQVAAGMTELGRAGFKPTEILNAIGPMLDLSRATSTELPEAVAIAGAALRGFGLDTTQTTRVADVLVATANKSAQTLTELGESMKYVAPQAAAAGENIENTAAALGVLANNGIKGSMAGTALARAYKNLSREQMQKTLAKVNVAAVDSSGNLRKMADILTDIGKATASMGTARRLAIFEELFGRGQAAALKLAKAGSFENMREQLTGIDGVARRTAVTMDDTLGGSFRKLMSAVEGVQIAIGEALTPTLRKWMGDLTRIAGGVTRFISAHKELVVTWLKWAAIIGAVGAALIGLAGAATVASFVIGGLGTIFSAITGILSGIVTIGTWLITTLGAGLAALASPLGIIVGGFIALAAGMAYAGGYGGKLLKWLGERFKKLKETALEAFQGIKDALIAGDFGLAARILWLTLKMEWQKGIHWLTEWWVAFKEVFMKTATDAFYGAVKILAGALDGLRALWVITVNFLSKVWTNFTSGVQKAWNTVQGFLTKGFLKVMSLWDENLTPEALEQGYKNIDAETDQRQPGSYTEARRRAQGKRAAVQGRHGPHRPGL